MMSRKEYWQNRKDRLSLRIHLCVSERSERAIFGVFNSFTVKNVNFFTINVKFKVILSSKSGGGGDICTGHPPTQKSGGGGGGNVSPPPHPPGIYASGTYHVETEHHDHDSFFQQASFKNSIL